MRRSLVRLLTLLGTAAALVACQEVSGPAEEVDESELTFVQFAQAPHFNHLAAVYGSFDFSGPLDLVRKSAGLSDKVMGS